MSDYEIESFEHQGYTVTIETETDPSNPREWGNVGTMLCSHRRYALGDEDFSREFDFDAYGSWSQVREALERDYDARVILPLYLYDHSGLTINTTGFSCPWDSGQVGFIFASAAAIRAEYGVARVTAKVIEQATQRLLSEVEVYDMYLRDDIYRFTVEDGQGEIIDSGGDIYELDEARRQARRAASDAAKSATV